jgi:hypothetical protein
MANYPAYYYFHIPINYATKQLQYEANPTETYLLQTMKRKIHKHDFFPI